MKWSCLKNWFKALSISGACRAICFGRPLQNENVRTIGLWDGLFIEVGRKTNVGEDPLIGIVRAIDYRDCLKNWNGLDNKDS